MDEVNNIWRLYKPLVTCQLLGLTRNLLEYKNKPIDELRDMPIDKTFTYMVCKNIHTGETKSYLMKHPGADVEIPPSIDNYLRYKLSKHL